MLISADYAKLNEQLHHSRPEYGTSGRRWAPAVAKLAEQVGARTVLDYGCGKQTLATALPDLHVVGYDPAVPGLDAPAGPADLVVCTDVLEHVEPECIDAVLDDLCRVTQKAAFVTVATRPALKTLADGRNAHLTVQPLAWWRASFESRFDIIEVREFDGLEFALVLKALHADVVLGRSAGSASSATTEVPLESSVQLDVVWAIFGLMFDEAAETSLLASHRYRALIPGRSLRSSGHRVDFIRGRELSQLTHRPNVVVVSKLFSEREDSFDADAATALRSIEQLQAQGTAVVVDVCDDHFDDAVKGGYWRNVVRAADLVCTASEAMAAIVRQYSQRPIRVIGDPLASPFTTTRVSRTPGWSRRLLGAADQPLRLVWYGFINNAAALRPWGEALAQAAIGRQMLIQVVTMRHPVVTDMVDGFNREHDESLIRMELIEWSEDAQWRAVSESDVVLIPVDAANPKKHVKSANRLSDALHCGRFVIASDIPAYRPYADYAALTDAPAKALAWYLKHPDEALEKARRGQAEVIKRCDASVVADHWREALMAAGSEAARHQSRQLAQDVQPSTTPVKLNLGCGDKILPGYVNVDVIESRGGRKPDVLCDLRNLESFASDSADEVMAVHVVEHFWRWEVDAVLREWIRVLKPGGQLVLECPNLTAACQAFLAAPDEQAGPGIEGQQTMWVFYGDPAWQDPLMVHRWGYTPRSLSTLLTNLGLVDVHQAPAQFKLREPRDMRIVGSKPVAKVD